MVPSQVNAVYLQKSNIDKAGNIHTVESTIFIYLD